MKRALLILAALALVAVAACAQIQAPDNVDVIYDGDIPRDVYWDPVTESVGGIPYLAGEIRYEVFAYSTELFGTIDDQVPANVVSLGETLPDTPNMTIDISSWQRGFYYIGVRAIGDDGQGTVAYSDIAWSYDPVVVDPTPGRSAYLVDGGMPTDLSLPTGLGTIPVP